MSMGVDNGVDGADILDTLKTLGNVWHFLIFPKCLVISKSFEFIDTIDTRTHLYTVNKEEKQ